MSLTGLAFLLVFAAGLGFALFRHPIYGLYTYVAVFYLHPPSRWWGETLPDLRWSLVAAVITVIATMRLANDESRPSWISTTPAKLIIAFTVWLWIQNIWALDADDQLECSILFTKYVALFYVMYRILDTPEKITNFFVTHVAGCLYLGWLAYDAKFSGRLEGVGGPGINEANALAMQMGTGIAVGAMLILGSKGWHKWLCFAAMPLALNTLVLASSRGAFLSMFAAGVALWMLKPKAHRTMFYVYATLGVILAFSLTHEAFWERMGTITVAAEHTEEADVSAQSRVALIKAQTRMAMRYPHGTGHRGTAVLSPSYLDPRFLSRRAGTDELGARSSHNTFMSAWVEQGIPGALIFIALWLWAGRSVLKLKGRIGYSNAELATLTAAVGGALAVVFVAGFFVDYLKTEVQFWCFAILACLLELAKRATARAPASAPSPAEVPVPQSVRPWR